MNSTVEHEWNSPYLPQEVSGWRQCLRDGKYALVYRVWKRHIRRYCRNRGVRVGNLRILEVGCGPGNFVLWLSRWFEGSYIKAVDADPHLLAYAARRVQGVHFERADACELVEWDHYYDIVSCLQVVEHLERPDVFLQLARDCLKPGGVLLLATPNPCGLGARWLGPRWQGRRPDHISLRTPDKWRADIRMAGLEIVDEGTTLFNGMPIIGRFPLGVLGQALLSVFGYFHWQWGESNMVVARKPVEET